jgi:hypothetical protein
MKIEILMVFSRQLLSKLPQHIQRIVRKKLVMGEILMGEFLEPMRISQYRLAKDISVPPRRINESDFLRYKHVSGSVAYSRLYRY